MVWLIYRFEPQARAGNIRPELFIEINWIAGASARVGHFLTCPVFALPICLFFFGWTANRTVRQTRAREAGLIAKPWYVPGTSWNYVDAADFASASPACSSLRPRSVSCAWALCETLS